MPVTVKWYDPEHTITYYQFEGKWTLAELDVVIKEVQSWGYIAYLDIIVNMQASRGIPADMLSQLRSLQIPMSDLEWTVAVIVTSDSFAVRLVRAFASIFPQYGKRFVLARSDEDALDIIRNIRKKLPRFMSDQPVDGVEQD